MVKKILLLDANGPLGEFVKLWLKVAASSVKGEKRKELAEIMELVRQLMPARSETALQHFDLSEKTMDLMNKVSRLHPHVREAFEDKLREYLNDPQLIESIRRLSERFDYVAIYTDMPHPVAESIARVLNELIGEEKIRAIGTPTPTEPVPARQIKIYRESEWRPLESGKPPIWGEIRKIFGIPAEEKLHVTYVSDDPPEKNHIHKNLLREHGVETLVHIGKVTREGGEGYVSINEVAKNPKGVSHRWVIKIDSSKARRFGHHP